MFTKNLGLSLPVAIAVCLGYAGMASAQSASQSPVTTSPTPLSGNATPLTNDSTLQCGGACAASAVSPSTVLLGGAAPPSPPPPPPPPPPLRTCNPGQTTLMRQSGGMCPGGSAAYNPYGGNGLLFTQTQTRTETCPAGVYGAPVYTYSGWVPASGSDPSACGYPSGTGVQIGVNNQANNYGTVNGTTGNYPMGRRGGNPGGPHAQFSGTWTWNGQTKFVQVTCGGPGETESCSKSVVQVIGGVGWTFSVWGSSLLQGDCMKRPGQPWDCPLNGGGQVGAP